MVPKKYMRIFRSRNFIFSLALILGVFCGHGAQYSKWAVLPALAVVMTVSTLGIPAEFFRLSRSMVVPIASGIFMSFIIQAGTVIGLGTLLLSDKVLWTGVVLVASVPPAVAIIPFTSLLDGNTEFSLMATIGAYIFGLAITPLICLGFIGASIINPIKVLIILGELVIAPILASRVLIFLRLDKGILPHKGVITNWGFFVVIYTIMGLNQKIFFNHPQSIIPLLFIFFSSTFLLGALIDFTVKIFKADLKLSISLNLLGTLKNAGTAAGIALVLFGETAALPAAISTTFMILYFIWLGIKKNWIAAHKE